MLFAWDGLACAEDLLWFEDNHPKGEVWQALNILETSFQDGLDPARYKAESLHSRFSEVGSEGQISSDQMVMLNQDMTDAMMKYLRDQHFGQIDPHQIQENFSQPLPESFDILGYLQGAIRAHRLVEAVSEVTPSLPMYAHLRTALSRYRDLAKDPAKSSLWQHPLPALPGTKLEPGQSYSGMKLLSQRLIALGDMSHAASSPSYSKNIVDGVKSFQNRHGLAADGIIGASTIDRLNVPPAVRARQIELAMERLRWIPLLRSPRMVFVNIPEHILDGYEVVNNEIIPRVHMRVIIGKAPDKQTPIFDEDMRFIEFSPYWNVPYAIAKNEVIPSLIRNPANFVTQGYEFVSRDGQVITSYSEASINAVAHGLMRLRQRPGPHNALGDIKFSFPNKDHIYLHHTQSTRLFQRDRRDFSHGCVRVEDPFSLARFVLATDPTWDDERIKTAMDKGVSMTQRLKEPVRVVIAYSTAVARNDGKVCFFPDIYGQDILLEEALQHVAPDTKSGSALALVKTVQ